MWLRDRKMLLANKKRDLELHVYCWLLTNEFYTNNWDILGQYKVIFIYVC